MFDLLREIFSSAEEGADFTAFDDFSSVDTLQYPNNQLAFFSLKELKVSPWVRSYDMMTYGAQAEGHIQLRLMGKRCRFADCTELEDSIAELIYLLGFRSDVVITSINKENVFENRILGRLECRIGIDVKMLITENSLWGGE